MRDERNPELLKNLIDKIEILKKRYLSRHEFWKKELRDSELKTVLIDKSHDPAMVFFDIVENNYIPAVRYHNSAKVYALIKGRLKDAYEKHRTAIDAAVKLAEYKKLLIRERVDTSIRWTKISSIIFSLIILGVVILLAFYIKNSGKFSHPGARFLPT